MAVGLRGRLGGLGRAWESISGAGKKTGFEVTRIVDLN
jgi:hypothetical protein